MNFSLHIHWAIVLFKTKYLSFYVCCSTRWKKAAIIWQDCFYNNSQFFYKFNLSKYVLLCLLHVGYKIVTMVIVVTKTPAQSFRLRIVEGAVPSRALNIPTTQSTQNTQSAQSTEREGSTCVCNCTCCGTQAASSSTDASNSEVKATKKEPKSTPSPVNVRYAHL